LKRPSWVEYFMQIAEVVASRSTCLRRKVGAVLVKDKRIIATGYNGPPHDLKNCYEIGCLREKLKVPSGERHELCRGLHAEQNAIIQCALHGVSAKGAILFSTHFPCSLCIKMIINAGIRAVVYKEGYSDELGKKLAEEVKLPIYKFSPTLEEVLFSEEKKREKK